MPSNCKSSSHVQQSKISNIFCGLLFASKVFKLSTFVGSAAARTGISQFHFPTFFPETLSLLYWLSSKSSSNLTDFYSFQSSEEISGDRLQLEIQYVDETATYFREGSHSASFLDKPNAQSNVPDLVLEGVHKTFKKWLKNN